MKLVRAKGRRIACGGTSVTRIFLCYDGPSSRAKCFSINYDPRGGGKPAILIKHPLFKDLKHFLCLRTREGKPSFPAADNGPPTRRGAETMRILTPKTLARLLLLSTAFLDLSTVYT